MTNQPQPELYLAAGNTLGEGPFWHPTLGELFWVDIQKRRLHRYQPDSQKEHIYGFDEYISAAAPRRSGGLVLAMQHGFALFDLNTGQIEYLEEPEAHLTENRFNDGKCDPAGRFLAGSMHLGENEPAGSLYALDPDYRVRKLVSQVRISNGLGWSPDQRTFYYIDTPTRQVTAYDYDLPTGQIANPRPVIGVPDGVGFPDGMTVDQEGLLWIAMWGGGSLTRWDPVEGKLVETYPLPALNVTSCAFGGPDLDELYITTARTGLNASTLQSYPGSGHIFRLKTRVKGQPAYEFTG